MKPFVLLFTGGTSSEREISIKSAQNVRTLLEDTYSFLPIEIKSEGWFHLDTGDRITLEAPSGVIRLQNDELKATKALIMVHGAPGENGILQGLLDLCNIEYNTGGVLNLSLTFNKTLSSAFLTKMGFPMAKSQTIQWGEPFELNCSFPLFCKPSEAGSSFGISLVEQEEDLPLAIEKAALECPEILLEERLVGREISCGVFKNKTGEIIALNGTEIITDRPFFDYEAKYQGLSQEITPAPLGTTQLIQLQELTRSIYKSMNCNGLARVDFILEESGFKVIEVNTVPGFTNESIVPQQLQSMGIPMTEVFYF